MKTITATAALMAAVSLAACQPAADGAQTADAATAEGAAVEASASGSGEVLEARVREGLWQTTMTMGGMPEGMPPLSSRMCMDEQMTALDTGSADQAGVQNCQQSFDRTAEGLDFTSRCEMDGGGVTETQGSITGDFQTAYRMEATVTTTGTGGADGTVSMTTEAAYQGPCPEGWRGGDVETSIMGRTVRTNVHDMANAAAGASAPTG